LIFLGLILGAVFIEQPLFVREALMIGAAAGSYFTTRASIHRANDFNFHPVQEVVILFAGIFCTMMPALDWLQANAARFGQPTPGLYFWGSGALSSVLDNAPTYLSFLSAALGSFAPDAAVAAARETYAAGLTPERAQMAVLMHDPAAARTLIALSVGSVSSAPTLTSATAEFHGQGHRRPTTRPHADLSRLRLQVHAAFMVPMLVVVGWLFFR